MPAQMIAVAVSAAAAIFLPGAACAMCGDGDEAGKTPPCEQA
jgi:hypothetical protein